MMGSDSTWVGRKPVRRLGGMSDALSIAADLGFAVSPPPSQEEIQCFTIGSCEKSDDLVRVLKELTVVQRKIADLQVELQGRKEDKNIAHLTHVSEMEKKIKTLARITTILKDVIQNKDRIIARLQQPYSLDCIPVEAEYQKQFSELLMRAASDYNALTTSAADFQWSQNFKDPPTTWAEMLRPIPVALASCTRFFEAMSAMRESFATLQALRAGPLPSGTTPSKAPPSQGETWKSSNDRTSFDDLAIGSNGQENEEQEVARGREQEGGVGSRRLSWPSPIKKFGMYP